MALRTWYLVRHGETEWNAISRMQGQLDSRLTLVGREQASGSARLLGRLGVDRIFSSPLGRARETAALINEVIPLPVTFDARLQEWSAGAWSGELYEDVRTKWPGEWAAWHADRYVNRSPGGENFKDLFDRARSFFGDVTPTAPEGSHTAIVGHGFMNKALAAVLLSLTPDDALSIHQTNDAMIRVVEHDNGPAVDHFVAGDGPFDGLPSHIRPTPVLGDAWSS